MARKPALHTVKPGDPAPTPAKPKKPMTLAEAIERGTYLDILEAQRRQVAADLPSEKGPAKAALHRQLALLSREIEELKAKAADDDDDDDLEAEDEEWIEGATV